MSAYICNPEVFGILASYATLNHCAIPAWQHSRNPAAEVETAQRVAKGLARENIRSVAHLYPNDKDGNRPGPCLLAAEIEEAAALYAAHFWTNSHHVSKLRPAQVLKLCQSFEYQSCETDDWRDTLARMQLNRIRAEALRRLLGYEEANWDFLQPIPEIETLYKGRSA